MVRNAFILVVEVQGTITYSVLERTPHGTDPAGATHPDSPKMASQGRKRNRDVNSSVFL